jgi:hypothetical protein
MCVCVCVYIYMHMYNVYVYPTVFVLFVPVGKYFCTSTASAHLIMTAGSGPTIPHSSFHSSLYCILKAAPDTHAIVFFRQKSLNQM